MERINNILNFWFEGITDATPINSKTNPFRKWFTKNLEFDKTIRLKFERDLGNAQQGAYKLWEKTAHGRLALIVLCDQFSRNMYRNTPKMFASDDTALDLAVRSIKQNMDKELMLIERVFMYMPLEHAEDLKVQELSLRCFDSLIQQAQQQFPANVDYYKSSYDYARRHHAIIQRFDRFPHRNAILGRASTSEEEAFLKTRNSSF